MALVDAVRPHRLVRPLAGEAADAAVGARRLPAADAEHGEPREHPQQRPQRAESAAEQARDEAAGHQNGEQQARRQPPAGHRLAARQSRPQPRGQARAPCSESGSSHPLCKRPEQRPHQHRHEDVGLQRVPASIAVELPALTPLATGRTASSPGAASVPRGQIQPQKTRPNRSVSPTSSRRPHQRARQRPGRQHHPHGRERVGVVEDRERQVAQVPRRQPGQQPEEQHEEEPLVEDANPLHPPHTALPPAQGRGERGEGESPAHGRGEGRGERRESPAHGRGEGRGERRESPAPPNRMLPRREG